MRKMFIVGVVAALGVGFAGNAFANYFWPGKVIIGTGIIWGGSTTGSTLGGGSSKMMDGPCQDVPPIECECFPGMPLLDACKVSGAEIGCLGHDVHYDVIKQEGLVVIADGSHTLGGVMCSGKSDGTALINLPK